MRPLIRGDVPDAVLTVRFESKRANQGDGSRAAAHLHLPSIHHPVDDAYLV